MPKFKVIKKTLQIMPQKGPMDGVPAADAKTYFFEITHQPKYIDTNFTVGFL